MNYVFFDVECANCLNGEGKICSFGYVKTDENFQVLRKRDILINPNAPFLLGNVRSGEGIKLAYPLFRFQRSYTFPHYYEEIKKLLSAPDTLSFGFAVHQDVSYISYTCRRYNLPRINFSFFDIQKMEKELNHRKDCSGLDSLVKEYGVTSYTYHRSDDDALMTMEVFKALLEQNNMSVEEALKKYSDALSDTEKLLADIVKRHKIKEQKKAYQTKLYNLYSKSKEKYDINLYNPFFYQQRFYFRNDLLKKEVDVLLREKTDLERRGAILTRNPQEASRAVVFRKGDKIPVSSLPETVEYVTWAQFENELKSKGNGIHAN